MTNTTEQQGGASTAMDGNFELPPEVKSSLEKMINNEIPQNSGDIIRKFGNLLLKQQEMKIWAQAYQQFVRNKTEAMRAGLPQSDIEMITPFTTYIEKNGEETSAIETSGSAKQQNGNKRSSMSPMKTAAIVALSALMGTGLMGAGVGLTKWMSQPNNNTTINSEIGNIEIGLDSSKGLKGSADWDFD